MISIRTKSALAFAYSAFALLVFTIIGCGPFDLDMANQQGNGFGTEHFDLPDRQVVVQAYWPGATAEELEIIAAKIEEIVSDIHRLENTRTFVRLNIIETTLTFGEKSNIKNVLREVRTQLDSYPAFPSMMEDINIRLLSDLRKSEKKCALKIDLELPLPISEKHRQSTIENARQVIQSIAPESKVEIEETKTGVLVFVNNVNDSRAAEPKLRAKFSESPGIGIYIENKEHPSREMIVILTANERHDLLPYFKQMPQQIAQVSGTRNFRMRGHETVPQITVTPDREKMKELGIPERYIAQALNISSLSNGKGDSYILTQLNKLDNVQIKTKDGSKISLKEIAKLEAKPVLDQIARYNSKPAAEIRLTVDNDEAFTQAKNKIENLVTDIQAETPKISIHFFEK